jgi:hypothetical protein
MCAAAVARARRVKRADTRDTALGYAPTKCGRYATFGPVSVSREAKAVLDELELDLISEIDQRDDQFNIVPAWRVMASGEHG